MDEDFGAMLATLRRSDGITQKELAGQLNFGRSTLANIEAGREPPSNRFWTAIVHTHSDWVAVLGPLRATNAASTETAHDEVLSGEDWVLGGPFTVENLTLTYIFEFSPSPSEILEVRRVRATRNGADSYGLKLVNTTSDAFTTSEEPLWGGHLEKHVSSAAGYLRRFRFDKTLRRGQTHEFATRQWVERDTDPGTAVGFHMTIPALTVGIHLHFRGPSRPKRIKRYGPLPDERDIPHWIPLEGGDPVPMDGTVSETFRKPEPGACYGLAWEW